MSHTAGTAEEFSVYYRANGRDWHHADYSTQADASSGVTEAMEMAFVDSAWVSPARAKSGSDQS